MREYGFEIIRCETNTDLYNRWYYNFISEVYLYEDNNNSVPFEEQQLSFEFGTFRDKFTGITHDLSAGYLVPNPYLFPVVIPASDVTTTTERKTDHNGFVFYREEFYHLEKVLNPIIGGVVEWTGVFTEPILG